jgi:hypothetical protein
VSDLEHIAHYSAKATGQTNNTQRSYRSTKLIMPSDKAIQPGHTKRYLPEKAWASLSKEERAKTDAKKKAGSKQGKQFVPNTEAAKKAGKKARTPKKK